MRMCFSVSCLGAMIAMIGASDAASPACAPIEKAFQAVAAAPNVRQTMELTGPQPMKMESIFIGDTLYVLEGQKWRKITLKKGGRIGILNSMMDMSALYDCKETRTDALSTGATQVYEYMMTPPKGLPGADNTPMRGEIWVGVADGLIYRMKGEKLVGVLSYGPETPPVP